MTSSTSSDPILLYTDGSCLGNPGRGGWAAMLSSQGSTRRLSGGFALTTNNRMEIYGALMGLEALTRPCTVELFSDSRYLCDAVGKGWLTSWQKRGWKKADGKPALNRDLWERLLVQLARHRVRFRWVRGHAGHPENEEVDALAREFAARRDLPEDSGYRPG